MRKGPRKRWVGFKQKVWDCSPLSSKEKGNERRKVSAEIRRLPKKGGQSPNLTGNATKGTLRTHQREDREEGSRAGSQYDKKDGFRSSLHLKHAHPPQPKPQQKKNNPTHNPQGKPPPGTPPPPPPKNRNPTNKIPPPPDPKTPPHPPPKRKTEPIKTTPHPQDTPNTTPSHIISWLRSPTRKLNLMKLGEWLGARNKSHGLVSILPR